MFVAVIVEPQLHQSWWFLPTLFVISCVGLAGVWRWRMSIVKRELGLVAAERVRLSREIHDTLLQDLVGIMLELEAIATQCNKASPQLASSVLTLRRRVQGCLRSARKWIANQRMTQWSPKDLLRALRSYGRNETKGTTTSFRLAVDGNSDWCPPDAGEQLLRIAEEAIRNARRHACASTIRAELRFSPDSVLLRVSDDGCGIAPKTAGQNPTSVHFGFINMKERAELIGGELSVSTDAQHGTTIEVRVPVIAESGKNKL